MSKKCQNCVIFDWQTNQNMQVKKNSSDHPGVVWEFAYGAFGDPLLTKIFPIHTNQGYLWPQMILSKIIFYQDSRTSCVHGMQYAWERVIFNGSRCRHPSDEFGWISPVKSIAQLLNCHDFTIQRKYSSLSFPLPFDTLSILEQNSCNPLMQYSLISHGSSEHPIIQCRGKDQNWSF